MAKKGDIVLTFGKHKGEELGNVPAQYLIWLWNNFDDLISKHPDIYDYIEENFKSLEMEAAHDRYRKK